MIYYVSKNGSDFAAGTKEAPFATIGHAASIAFPGDTVRVHGGVYREWVSPRFGGTSEHNRIVYEAVEGERPIIKGSEAVTGWEKVKGTVWKKTLLNSFFGEFNPYATAIAGDWMHTPCREYQVHYGDIYLNGKSFYEATDEEELYSDDERAIPPCTREVYFLSKYGGYENPKDTLYRWRAVVDKHYTTIYANFREYDPNRELVEINVRPCCFYPRTAGVNFITLRGFEIAQAASPWTPPTVNQPAMVGAHFSRGWVIENNIMHDAKCSAISIGKDETTGDGLTRFGRKSGHRYQLEAVFEAVRKGWDRSTVGSHLIQNNEIYDCGQNAIVGHMGCIYSVIRHNHVHHIGKKYEYMGSEQAGIKFHGAIDTLIEGNNIHNCTLGTWLDWQAQGTRLSRNLYHKNERDLEIEVSHGPCLVDNNIFLSPFSFDCYSQGNALVHNLFLGNMHDEKVWNRTTPYHYPHSTLVAGVSETLGGDHRCYNNLFAGRYPSEGVGYGTKTFDDFADCFDKYSTPKEFEVGISEKENGERGSLGAFLTVPQPVWMGGNCYSGFAKASRHDADAVVAQGLAAELRETEETLELILTVPEDIASASCAPVTTKRLGETRISSMPFEAPDGTDYDFSFDLLGEKRTDRIKPGPFATLSAGTHTLCVWKKNLLQ